MLINFIIVAIVGFEQLSYTVSENSDSQEVCMQIFNPPSNEQLTFTITLVYQSKDGTAGMYI